MTAKKNTNPAPAATPAVDKAPAPSFPLCGCGCGVPTVTAKALFLSGHDARHAGVLGRALAATPDDTDLNAAYDRLSDRLRAKVDGIRATAERKQAEKEARLAAKAASKAAYEAALTEMLSRA